MTGHGSVLTVAGMSQSLWSSPTNMGTKAGRWFGWVYVFFNNLRRDLKLETPPSARTPTRMWSAAPVTISNGSNAVPLPERASTVDDGTVIDISDSEDDRNLEVQHRAVDQAAKRAAQQVVVRNASLTWHDNPVSDSSNTGKSGSDFEMEDDADANLSDYSSDGKHIANSMFTPAPSRLHKRLHSSDIDASPPRRRLPSWARFSPSRHSLAPISHTPLLRLPHFATTPSPKADSDNEEGSCQAGCCFSPMSHSTVPHGHHSSATSAYRSDCDQENGTSHDGDSAEDEGVKEPAAKSWPGDFFVVDVIKGFADIDAGLREKQPLQTLFEDLFGVDFKGTTYHDHRRRWAAASPQSRQNALSSRRQLPDGLWSTFMRTNPAQNADKKARQRKLREDAKKGLSSSHMLT